MRLPAIVFCLALISGSVAQHSPDMTVSPDKAIALLKAGNARFAAGNAQHPRAGTKTRHSLAHGQHPFAVVVACSDSRVGPELVFDQGLGDLFVVRCAGNTVDAVAAGSIEYAIRKLGAKFIFVMGHEHCGAVHAAIEGGVLPGSIGAVVAPILPAVEAARKEKGDLEHNSSVANIKNIEHTMGKIDSLMGEILDKHEVGLSGGIYDLETGKITIVK